jgi:hypothetical protein
MKLMKRISSSFLVVAAVLTLATATTFAAPKSAASNRHGFLVGLALDKVYTGSNSVPGLTALLIFNDKNALQLYFGMSTVQPALLGGGAQFKHTLVGDVYKGFHIGGGVGLGAAQPFTATYSPTAPRSFYVTIAPGLGGHFEVSDGVIVSFDASYAFQLFTSAAKDFDMWIGGNSTLLGASVVFAL